MKYHPYEGKTGPLIGVIGSPVSVSVPPGSPAMVAVLCSCLTRVLGVVGYPHGYPSGGMDEVYV